MIKFYLKDNNKEVKIGDTIAVSVKVNTIFGEANATAHVVVNQDSLKKLIEQGIVIKKDTTAPTVDLFISMLADRLEISIEEIKGLLNGFLDKGVHGIVLQLLLKEASTYFARQESAELGTQVYTIALHDGRIHAINITDVKKYDHFAYFVTKSQAKQAKSVLYGLFKEMYE